MFLKMRTICAIFILLLPSSLWAATVTWDSGALTTDWADDANWIGGVAPVTADDVVIGASTVVVSAGLVSQNSISLTGAILQVDATSTIVNLTMSGGARVEGTGNVEVTSTFDWNWATIALTEGAYFVLRAGATSDIGDGVSDSILEDCDFNNYGSITWLGTRPLRLTLAATFNNYDSFLIESDSNLYGDIDSRFIVWDTGTLTKTSSGITNIQARFRVINGSVNVEDGTLNFVGNSADPLITTGGSWTARSAITDPKIIFNGSATAAHYEIGAATQFDCEVLEIYGEVDDTILFNTAAAADFVVDEFDSRGFIVTFNAAPVMNLDRVRIHQGCTLSGTSSIQVSGDLNWDWATVSLSSGEALTILPGATGVFGDGNGHSFLTDCEFDNYGDLSWVGVRRIELTSAAVFNNYGNLDIDFDSAMQGDDTSVFNLHNTGTLTKTSTGTTTIQTRFRTFGGAVVVEDGTLKFTGDRADALITSGDDTWTARSATTDPRIAFYGGAEAVHYEIGAATQFDCEVLEIYGGVNDTILFNTAAAADFVVDEFDSRGFIVTFNADSLMNLDRVRIHQGCVLAGDSNIQVSGDLNWDWATVNLSSGAVFTVLPGATGTFGDGNAHSFLDDCQFDNFGDLSWVGIKRVELTGAAVFNNYGSLDIDFDSAMQGDDTSVFNLHNTGTLTKTSTGTTTIQTRFRTFGGAVVVEDGTLKFTGDRADALITSGDDTWTARSATTDPRIAFYGGAEAVHYEIGAATQFDCEVLEIYGEVNDTILFNTAVAADFVVDEFDSRGFIVTFNADSLMNLDRVRIHQGCVLAGDSNIQVSGDLNWDWATVNLSSGAVLTVLPGATGTFGDGNAHSFLDDCQFDNFGDLSWVGIKRVELTGAAVVNNFGNLFIEFDTAMLSEPGCQFTNMATGAVIKTGGTGVSLFRIPFDNQGTIDVDIGTALFEDLDNYASSVLSGGTYIATGILQVQDASITQIDANVILDGPTAAIQDQLGTDALSVLASVTTTGALTLRNGAVVGPLTELTNEGAVAGVGQIDGDLLNHGTMLPGESPGIFEVSQDFGQNSVGSLLVEIGGLVAGTEYDQVQISGAATFTGTIDVQFIDAFVAGAGDEFTLMTYSSFSGVFLTENLPALSGGLQWSLDYTPTALVLQVAGHYGGLSLTSTGSLQDVDLVSGVTQFHGGLSGAALTPSSAQLTSAPNSAPIFALLAPGPFARISEIDPDGLTATTPIDLTYTRVSSVSAIAVNPYTSSIVVAFDGVTTQGLIGAVTPENRIVGPTASIVFSPSPPGAEIEMMAFSQAGELFALDTIGASMVMRLWKVDPVMRTATLVGQTQSGYYDHDGMTFIGNKLWATKSSTGEAILIDHTSGLVVQTTTLDTTGLLGITPQSCYEPDTGLVELTSDVRGSNILIDWSSYSEPANPLSVRVYRSSDPCELVYGDPELRIDLDATTTFPTEFLDVTDDFVWNYYRVDIITDDGVAKGEVVEAQLYTVGSYSKPDLHISEFVTTGTKMGESIEIQSFAPDPIDVTGYRLSNGVAEEALSGVISGNGFLVHTASLLGLSAQGGTLFLLPPSVNIEIDSVSWGKQGGAPAVPSGYSISRVPGTKAGDPDATSFELGLPTLGSANVVPAPLLGSSIVINEVFFDGVGGVDYVELINPLGATIALDQFALSDGASFLIDFPTGIDLAPGEMHVLNASSIDPFTADLLATTLYLYQVTESGAYQRIDQLGWGGSIVDFTPPTPTAPNDALVRTPDGAALYLGGWGANWLESGGDVTLFFGPQSPGLPNTNEFTVTLNVDPGGGGDFLTIGEALAVAVPGTQLLLAPETYNESVNLLPGVSLAGTGTAGQAAIIAGDGFGPAVVGQNLDMTSQLSNLTIQSTTGGMHLTNASILMRNVSFINNQSVTDGAGVIVDGGSPSFQGCLFDGNSTGGNGGAMHVISGTPAIDYSLFVNNVSPGDGAAIHTLGGSVSVSHSVFDLNSAAGGILHSNGGSIVSTYSALTNSLVGAALRSVGGTNSFSCGVIFNHPEATPISDTGITEVDVLSVDPMYCQPSQLNYSYADSSPLVALGVSCGAVIGIAGPPCSATASSVASTVPMRNGLQAPFPNPFNPSTTLNFEIARAGQVSLEIYDARGYRIALPVDRRSYAAGEHAIIWRGRNTQGRLAASGVYFAVLRLDGERVGGSRKLVLLK